jgi:hypothetical protein
MTVPRPEQGGKQTPSQGRDQIRESRPRAHAARAVLALRHLESVVIPPPGHRWRGPGGPYRDGRRVGCPTQALRAASVRPAHRPAARGSTMDLLASPAVVELIDPPGTAPARISSHAVERVGDPTTTRPRPDQVLSMGESRPAHGRRRDWRQTHRRSVSCSVDQRRHPVCASPAARARGRPAGSTPGPLLAEDRREAPA